MFKDIDDQINNIKNLVADDLNQVNQIILDCAVPNINSDFIINGKQLRPLLLLLSAYASGYSKNKKHIELLAAAISLIHSASLLHDDVLDNSLIRRNKKTINAALDNKYAILAGDFLYSEVFKLIAQIENNNNNKIISLIADTTNLMITGEILQLSEQYNFKITEKKYLQIITAKTAQLFLVSMQLPNILITENLENLEDNCLAECGLNFGIAYQLLDDIFDYYKLGNDTAEGRITLPIIFLLNNSNTDLDSKIKNNIINIILDYKNCDQTVQLRQLESLKKIILNYGGFNYVLTIAKQYLIKAADSIKTLNDSKYKHAILQIIDCFLDLACCTKKSRSLA